MRVSSALIGVGSCLWVLGGIVIGAVLVAVPYPGALAEAADGLVLIVVGSVVTLAARIAERRER